MFGFWQRELSVAHIDYIMFKIYIFLVQMCFLSILGPFKMKHLMEWSRKRRWPNKNTMLQKPEVKVQVTLWQGSRRLVYSFKINSCLNV